ncbi:MAG: hypothetical protein M3P27_00380, partial [Acidobacteriota bacterium]|nr:hypothetical protein [Acidobacteriota bacterium]
LRPDFVPAQELLSEAAERLGWDKLALQAFENRISLHPSCDTLQKAARLFAKSARYDKARALEDGLKDCGPQTLAYSDALSERGEHALAAASLATPTPAIASPTGRFPVAIRNAPAPSDPKINARFQVFMLPPRDTG